MKLSRLAFVAVAAMTMVSATASAQTVDRSETTAMLGWINETRAAEHLSPLTADGALAEVAESHSMDMASHRFFSHTSPTTGAPADRAAQHRIAYRSLAENIALNRSARAANDALFASPGHRSNLLDPGLRRIGIGIVRGHDGLYVTQYFATLQDESQSATPLPSGTPAATPQPTATPTAPTANTAPTQTPATTESDDEGDEAASDPSTPDGWGNAMQLPPWVQQWVGPMMGAPSQPTAQAPTPAPETRARNNRRAPAQASAQAGTTRTVTIPTMFGPVVMQMPQEFFQNGVATNNEPAGEEDDSGVSVDEARTAPRVAPRRRPTAPRVAPPAAAPVAPTARPQSTPYRAPRPMTTPGRVTTIDLPPIT